MKRETCEQTYQDYSTVTQQSLQNNWIKNRSDRQSISLSKDRKFSRRNFIPCSNFSVARLVWIKTSSNQRLWECVRRYLKWLTCPTFNLCVLLKSKRFSSTTGFLQKIFSGKVHVILLEEVTIQTSLHDGASFRRLTSIIIGLKYLHQPLNFVLNILTLTCNV